MSCTGISLTRLAFWRDCNFAEHPRYSDIGGSFIFLGECKRIQLFVGSISLLQGVVLIQGMQIDSQSITHRIIAKDHSIVHCLLQFLSILAVKIISTIIAKTPNYLHNRIGVLQPMKLLTTYPTIIRLQFSLDNIAKCPPQYC